MRRLDLLADHELDALQARHRDAAEAALAQFDALDVLMARELAATSITEAELERHAPKRPLLAVFVCLECGAADVTLTSRSWAVDRAMRRSALAERDVLAVERLLINAWGDVAPAVDRFSPEALDELRVLVGHDTHMETLRVRTVELLGEDGAALAEHLPALSYLYGEDDVD